MYQSSQPDKSRLSDIFMKSFAPAIVDFTRWVLESAMKDGRKRLYFLARDAYIPYLIASRIVKQDNLDIEVKYLYVSRFSLRKAEFALLDTEIAGKIAIGGIDVTFGKIMDRAGIDRAKGLDILKDMPIDKGYDDILSIAEITRLRDYISNDKKLLTLIRTTSLEAYENTMGYLSREGLLDDISYGIVDSGWVGSIQETLRHLLWTVKPVQITGYYFGLYELPQGVESSHYKSFYFRPYGDIRKKVYFSNCLFETVFSAMTGMTKGYASKESDFNPIYENNASLNQNEISIFCECADKVSVEKATNRVVEAHLAEMVRVMSEPTPEEARYLGGLRFCDDVIENTVLDIAAPLTDSDIRKIYRVRSGWTEASIVNTDRFVPLRLEYLRLYKYLSYSRKRLMNKN